jgi:hypothetical protein
MSLISAGSISLDSTFKVRPLEICLGDKSAPLAGIIGRAPLKERTLLYVCNLYVQWNSYIHKVQFVRHVHVCT